MFIINIQKNVRSNHANIELQDDSEIVSIIPCTQSKIENITETYNLGEKNKDFINHSKFKIKRQCN